METIVFSIFFILHLITYLINPGIPDRKYYSKLRKDYDSRDYNLHECKKCNIIVPKDLNGFHCHQCDVCVIEHDHHSFWMGKCIGKNNWFIFNAFLFFISIYCVISVLSLMFFVIFINEENYKPQGNE